MKALQLAAACAALTAFGTAAHAGPTFDAIKKNGVVTGFRSPAGVPKTPTGRPLNYSHVMHGLASAEWDKAAVPAQMGALVSALQNYIDGGGGVLGR